MIKNWKILRKICNKTKLKILDLLKERKLSISELKRELGINYKCVWLHIKSLEKLELIHRSPRKVSQGKKVIISLK